MRSMMTSLALRSEEEIDSAFFSKGGSCSEGGEKRNERTVRLTAKESASSSKWLENEGISNYAEAAVMFEGATDAAERENELLRKQWPEGDIEKVARVSRTSHSASPALATQTKPESAVVGPKSILKTSDAKVTKCFLNGSMTVGMGNHGKRATHGPHTTLESGSSQARDLGGGIGGTQQVCQSTELLWRKSQRW